jgi:Fe-S oxidoreductase
MDAEEFVDTLEWLGEEAVEDMEGIDEDQASVPINKEGAEYLYIPNPREYTSTPHMFTAYLRFFIASNVDWTYSSDLCDVSNWAYFVGDDETTALLAGNIVDAAEKLKVKTIVTTECGHGLSILRHELERLLDRKPNFEVISVVELAHRLFRDGTLKLKKGAIEQSVTYHDPCEVGRKLGVTLPPRELLKHVASDYREMTPDPKKSTCCGGGGGVVQNSDLGKKRLEFAKAKHDEIINTGAAIVSTSCQACLAQLKDMREHYNMSVTVKSVIELVVEALEE